MMLDYPFDEIVFFIDDETCAHLMRYLLWDDVVLTKKEQAILKLPDDEFLSTAKTGKLPSTFTDLDALQEMLEGEGIDLRRTSNFSGTAETHTELLPFITGECIEANLDDDMILHLPLDQQISLFRAAYPSPQALLAEVREKLQKYLPDDYDYAARICRVAGTYVC